jgi:hypothetical protein
MHYQSQMGQTMETVDNQGINTLLKNFPTQNENHMWQKSETECPNELQFKSKI